MGFEDKNFSLMKKNQQSSFFDKQSLSFGGSLLKRAHASGPRPVSSKHYLHVVLKSDVAILTKYEDLRLTKKRGAVDGIIKNKAETFGVRLHKVAIASNHIHLLISFKSRRKYFNWIRRVTGLIARLMLNAEKGKPSQKSFWTYRPFTRVVFWGRDYRGVYGYVQRNILEAIGFIEYIPRGYPFRNHSTA